RPRPPFDPSHLRSSYRTPEEQPHFEEAATWAHEAVACMARKHDACARRVDALVTERGRSLTKACPGVVQLFGQILRERCFGRRPAVVLLPLTHPLLAVVAFPAGHGGGMLSSSRRRRRTTSARSPGDRSARGRRALRRSCRRRQRAGRAPS